MHRFLAAAISRESLLFSFTYSAAIPMRLARKCDGDDVISPCPFVRCVPPRCGFLLPFYRWRRPRKILQGSSAECPALLLALRW